MHTFALAPYFHPTTVCFVDDNQAFLDSLELEPPRGWACRTFTDPKTALDYLEQPPALPPLMDRCFSMQRSEGEAIIRLDLDLVGQEFNHQGRFERTSVLVVDYSMPSMNGLDFCAAVTDPHVRKALLTGVADEKVAVEAFNAGLIHCFIPKQGNEPVERIFDFVDGLQQQYFGQYSARLKSALAIDPPGFLTDRVVADRVGALMRERNLVEYYLSQDPPGLILLDSRGRISRLAILSEAERAVQTRRAAGAGAPPAIVRGLERGSLLTCLEGDAPEDYFGETYPWSEKVQRAMRIDGPTGSYYAALWEDVAADIDYDPATASYDAYLARL
jgi:CheY-like chemotaxis protein